MSTTTLRLTPLIRTTTRTSLQMTPLRSTHRSLSCQGHSISRLAGTSASLSTSSRLASSAISIPQHAKADWGRLLKRSGEQAIVYFSFFAGVLGWPFAAKAVVEWSNGC